jgi:hypothetical protein
MLSQTRAVFVCGKCVEFDKRIVNYRQIRLQIPDDTTRDAIAEMIEETASSAAGPTSFAKRIARCREPLADTWHREKVI